MSGIQLPADLADRYELLADELDGFDDARELAGYVLESTADEIERVGPAGRDGSDSTASVTAGSTADDNTADDSVANDSAADDVVADRLERLGYLEK